MGNYQNKRVLVIGVRSRGAAACTLLQQLGAEVYAVDLVPDEESQSCALSLAAIGIPVDRGPGNHAGRSYDLVVLSPEVPLSSPLVASLRDQQVPIMGELELGFQNLSCLVIAVTGTNGKSTTASLITRLLSANHRKTVLAGGPEQPICAISDLSKTLDYVVLTASPMQLELTRFFRPTVSVLLNTAADHQDRFGTADHYTRVLGSVFANQQMFDWAIVQTQALGGLSRLDVKVPAKTITFSATDSASDLYLDRGLIVSRLADWSGPLLDMDHCRLRGPHNAENISASLAVGRVLRLPLESMMAPIKTFTSSPHCYETVADIQGVLYINDAKGRNLAATQSSILASRSGAQGEANIYLIAGGMNAAQEYHDLGPLLSKRVKRAILLGCAGEKIRAAWSLFTPCTVVNSLLEAVQEAARNAASGDVVLLSPACSSFNEFRDYRQLGEAFCQTVKSISRGAASATPNMSDISGDSAR